MRFLLKRTVVVHLESNAPYRTAIRTGGVLHRFRVPFREWSVTPGGAPGFALCSARSYFILPSQGNGNVQSPGDSHSSVSGVCGLVTPIAPEVLYRQECLYLLYLDRSVGNLSQHLGRVHGFYSCWG